MGRAVLEPELERELAEIAAAFSCELVHAEFKGDRLRLFIDHPEGVTLEHCEQVSRQVSALLDSEDFGDQRYVLEVSSPGLDRQLYKPADYQRFVGRSVRITYRDQESGKKRTISGPLLAFEAEQGSTTVSSREDGRDLVIPLSDIQKARLEIEL